MTQPVNYDLTISHDEPTSWTTTLCPTHRINILTQKTNDKLGIPGVTLCWIFASASINRR
jgi:hypothetical protein